MTTGFSSNPPVLPPKITVPSIRARKGTGARIVALTAYDFTFATLIDQGGVDMILVGDSLATVIQGYETTIPASLDEMIYHCRCVTRGVRRALVIGDLPFLSYQVSPEQALLSAGRLVKEGGVAAVKLEGGLPMEDTIRRLTDVDIAVIGHIGLTPQSYHRMGGHRVQGKTRDPQAMQAGSFERLLEDARAVERAGAFAVVLEGVTDELARNITAEISIPTIGIGAGADCDGQILVMHDLLGLTAGKVPSFVRQYADLGQRTVEAVSDYAADVRDGSFPEAKPSAAAKLNQSTK